MKIAEDRHGAAPATAPPRAAVPAVPGSPAPASAEALFKEAKRRRRRRRLAGLAAAVLLASAAAIGISAIRASGRPAAVTAGGGRAGSAAGTGIVAGTRVAWVDYHRHLHLGNLVTRTQHVVATITGNPSLPLTQAGGHIYWVDPRAYVRALHRWSPVIRELDVATGRIRTTGPGESVFPAADGRHVFIALTDTSLYEIPVTGSPGSPRLWRLPRGWFMPQGEAIAVGDGILIQSVYPLAGTRLPHKSHTFGVWYPRSGRVQAITRGYELIGAIGPGGAHGGLLAWLPISCSLGQNCPMRITNLQTLVTRLVPSPLGLGFTSGGAFSPDGRWLAVFVNLKPTLNGIPLTNMVPDEAQLALINTRTGVVRLVHGTRTLTVPPAAWAQWLPDSRHLVVGGLDASYLVNASAMTEKPMFFLPGHDHNIQDSEDLNFSSVIVPPHR